LHDISGARFGERLLKSDSTHFMNADLLSDYLITSHLVSGSLVCFVHSRVLRESASAKLTVPLLKQTTCQNSKAVLVRQAIISKQTIIRTLVVQVISIRYISQVTWVYHPRAYSHNGRHSQRRLCRLHSTVNAYNGCFDCLLKSVSILKYITETEVPFSSSNTSGS
jgi:hypothetical protein